MSEKISASAVPRLFQWGRLTAAGLVAALAAAVLPVALSAATAGPPEKALLRLHLTSYTNVQLLNEVDWDVLIMTSGKMQGFTTCGCEYFCTGLWITTASTAQLSPAQLSTLQAALANGEIGLQSGCSYFDGLVPGDGGTYQLQWYGATGRENILNVSLGDSNAPPLCSATVVSLLKTIDDLVIDVLGFPPTLAPETSINRLNACGGDQGN
jgi:hypothetical protein